MVSDKTRIAALRRRVEKARDFPSGTCPASRHLHIMADCLLKARPQTIVTDKGGKEYEVRYWMLIEEPEHCAESILAVLACLWEARTQLAGSETKAGE